MRQLTAYASYLDNLGAPLVGRARFYNMDGSPAVVYAWDNSTQDFIENGNIVFTNSSGQLEPQVFLDNHDYQIVFDKYIGAGTMSEDDDSESWEEQGSAIDKFNTVGIELSGGAIRAVSTIADLRQTHGIDTYEVIELMGYYDSGDKPIVYYKWNPFISTADNGGSIIKVDDVAAGRWELVSCPEYLDVRHFGAFPMQGIEENAEQRYNLTNAYTYAHSQGCGVYFWADATHAYYDISGANLIKVDSHPLARLFCVNDISGTSISDIKEVHLIGQDYGELASGEITLQGDVVRTSWGEETEWVIFDPSVKLVMDALIQSSTKNFDNIEVEILAYTSGCVFTNCLITSNGAINNTVTIADCEIRQEWFDENYNWGNLIPYQNDVRFKNFKDANVYVIVKNKQGEADYGDLEGKTISNIVLLADCSLENAVFATVALQGGSNLRNVSGTIVLQGASVSHDWVDCWLEITAFAGSISSFLLLRGSLTSSLVIRVNGDASFKDAEMDVLLMAHGKLTLEGCKIVEDMTGYNLQMSTCDVSAKVSIMWYNGKLEGDIQCNRFLTGGYLAVEGGLYTSGVIVLAISITGNYSNHDFWDDSAFDGVVHSTSGKITYEGNYGGCPGNRATYRSGMTFEVKNPYYTWGAVTDLAYNQGSNTIWMVDDARYQDNTVPEHQFWWSIKVDRTHNFDTLNLWRCKHLDYSRTVKVNGLFTANFTATNGEIVSFSFNPYTWQQAIGPAPQNERVQQETMTFQQVASSYYGPNNSDTYPSRLVQLLSGADEFMGSQLWEYEVS